MPDDLTGEGLLARVADRCGERFRRKALKESGKLRAEVRLFVNNDAVADPSAPIGARLGPGAELSIVLLTPLIGG